MNGGRRPLTSSLGFPPPIFGSKTLQELKHHEVSFTLYFFSKWLLYHWLFIRYIDYPHAVWSFIHSTICEYRLLVEHYELSKSRILQICESKGFRIISNNQLSYIFFNAPQRTLLYYYESCCIEICRLTIRNWQIFFGKIEGRGGETERGLRGTELKPSPISWNFT